MSSLDDIRNALAISREGIDRALQRLDDRAAEAVNLIQSCSGRVVISGVGKTGLIGRKIAATLSSTGTPAMFLHPAEALHGDLGAVQEGDVALVISNSGESAEIVELLPHLRTKNISVIALTGSLDSTLGSRADIAIDVGVDQESDPLNLAPTASTTAALAMGDALAAALMKARGFTLDDYAQNHPGGAIGSVLLTRVRDHMVEAERMPCVRDDVTLREAIHEMTARRLGGTFVIDGQGVLAGIFTDGDLLRLFEQDGNPLDKVIRDVMIANPKRTTPDTKAVDAMRQMEDHAITLLAVVDDDGKPVSALHMHDLVKAGLALWSSKQE